MIKFYFTSEPFQTKNTGDYDYIEQFTKSMNKYKHTSEILHGTKIGYDSQKLLNLYLNTLTKNVANKKLFYSNYNKLKNNRHRIEAVNKILDYINNEKYKYKILALQYRAPESGCLFYPEDLDMFRKNNIKVITTCHEFYLNVVREYLKEISVKILNKSDLSFFFNNIDYNEARKFGFKGKHKFTKQIPTVDFNIDKRNKDIIGRSRNILFFGLIRPKKGFESLLRLAEKIYNNPNKNIGKVIITGKCEINNVLIKNWINKLNNKMINKDLSVKKEYQHVLELKLNPTERELIKYINNCRYAYKPDGKGFSNNSSSIINLLNFGCIVYTKWGPYTPNFIIDKSSKYFGSIRLQDPIDTNILSNNKPNPLQVYNSIISSTKENDLISINKSKLLLKDIYNPYIIVNHYCIDVLILLCNKNFN